MIKTIKMYKDIINDLDDICLNIGALKIILDSRSRLSTSGKPTQWEIRTVLGRKPGDKTGLNDWKGKYVGNELVVTNNRTGEVHSMSVNELQRIASEEDLNSRLPGRNNPYFGSGQSLQPIRPDEIRAQRNLTQSFDDLAKLLMALGTISTAISAVKSGVFAAAARKAVAKLKTSKKGMEEAAKELEAAQKQSTGNGYWQYK